MEEMWTFFFFALLVNDASSIMWPYLCIEFEDTLRILHEEKN